LGKKSASKQNTVNRLSKKDYKFLQKLLPIFSADVTRINNLIGFVKRNGTVYYLNYQMPIYHHPEDDIASFKVFICQLYLLGNATQSEIQCAFGLAQKEMNRWLKKYHEEGPGTFYNLHLQADKT
jgi:hypothetical protein